MDLQAPMQLLLNFLFIAPTITLITVKPANTTPQWMLVYRSLWDITALIISLCEKLLLHCYTSRWVPEVRCSLLEQRIPPLSLWPQHWPGLLRPASPSTASSLTERSPVTQHTYPSANTAMYFHLLSYRRWTIGGKFFWTCLWLRVFLSAALSQLEQWRGSARWAGFPLRHCCWTQVSCRNCGNGDAWRQHSRGWPGL